LLAAMRTVEAELARVAGSRPTRQVRITTSKGF
jgi:hypothetical protein